MKGRLVGVGMAVLLAAAAPTGRQAERCAGRLALGDHALPNQCPVIGRLSDPACPVALNAGLRRSCIVPSHRAAGYDVEVDLVSMCSSTPGCQASASSVTSASGVYSLARLMLVRPQTPARSRRSGEAGHNSLWQTATATL